MKKNLVAASAVVLGLAMSGIASAGGTAPVASASQYYAGFYTAMTQFNNSTTKTHGLSLNSFGFLFGMNFAPFRVGVNLLHMNDVIGASLEGYYSIPLGSSLAAVLNAGVGYGTWLKGHNGNATNAKENHLTYKVGAGLSYKLTNSVDVFGTYNYISYTRKSADTAPKGYYNAFSLGVTVNF